MLERNKKNNCMAVFYYIYIYIKIIWLENDLYPSFPYSVSFLNPTLQSVTHRKHHLF